MLLNIYTYLVSYCEVFLLQHPLEIRLPTLIIFQLSFCIHTSSIFLLHFDYFSV
ncbi:hypothetical protein Smp_196520 [Schistosoma mansoni]|uniref:hypothetical protein n=1 Tax=Schistosoma mansoni TaxID=6183 RepID=UPI00022DBED3|nr:hypothetical protein Smp_196520 [Schistosoma mansoni]|eukprot:XP_018648864.1 hypothetical protein Smp_196520 [Schistosoma mansoni]